MIKEKLFNLSHSGISNGFEHIFRVIKRRFEILKKPQGYELQTQNHLVFMVIALHKYFIANIININIYDKKKIFMETQLPVQNFYEMEKEILSTTKVTEKKIEALKERL